VVVASKGLSGIGLPLSLIAYRAELDVWEPGAHIGTFRGHQLSFAAAVAAIRVMKRERILENVRARGAELLAGLAGLECAALHDVRGSGLILGVEFAHPKTHALLPDFASDVKRACFERGLLCELGGRKNAVLRLLPPLVISEHEAAEALSIIREAVAVTMQSYRFD
jgi:diaminobutyrate-2-oxoglutarate transaminase